MQLGIIFSMNFQTFNFYFRFYAKARGYTRYERIENAKTQIRQYYAHTVNAVSTQFILIFIFNNS